jgi:oxalate decarboxylase/phosphoglucose isomerase-like protein (cupin superfamily)
MFAIPLNCWHQHFNGSGQEEVRYVGVTNAPAVINMYDDIDFVFNTAYDFKSRFAGEPDYFSPKSEKKGFLLVTNFVPDAVHLPLISAKERGAAGGHIRFNMARGSMSSHISQFPVGTYKKAHCHGPSAHVIILSGEGFSLMWPEGEEPRRYDWHVGTLIVPPNKWFHQHFNTGPTPARYLAFKHEVALIRNAQGVPTAWISRRIGGDQIDYADEPQQVRSLFARELARHGMLPRMDEVYKAELTDLPAKSLQSEAAE